MLFDCAANFRQFYLLLWKNFALQIRRPVGTTFELILPLMAAVLVIILKHTVFDIEDKCFVTFEPDPITLPHVDTTIFYSPNTSETANSVMQKVVGRLPQISLMSLETERDLLRAIRDWRNNIRENNTGINLETVRIDSCINGYGVVFDDLDGGTLQYTIRPVHEVDGDEDLSTWNTDISQPRLQEPGPRFSPNNYLSEGFLHLQNLVGMSIIEQKVENLTGPNTFTEIPINMKQFPYPPYERNNFLLAVNNIMPLLLVLSFIYSAGILTRELVTEKETRLKESMKMMGLSGWILWLTWYLKQFLFLLVTALVMAILIKIDIFPESDFFLILIYLILFINCLIAWGFLISVFFSKAVIGMLVGFLAWFLNFFPYFFLANRYDELGNGEKIIACFLSNTCMGLGVNVFSTLEIREEGVTWGNAGESVSPDDDFNLGIVFAMLIFDSIIYMTIAWYIDAVFPGEYGIPKPVYFFVLPSYWLGTHSERVDPNATVELGDMNPNSDKNAHEREPAELDCGISIKGLGKVFKAQHGVKVAVDNLYMNMYRDQITVLLGHNGAGKTTTMSMLTGLFPPTSGDAIINGYSIVTDMDGVRQSLGLCPQHNVLYDRLTVREHLNFFARLKGMTGPGVKPEVDAMIEDLQLVDKANQKSSALSGGQKRKLSVGIALVAGSQFVILDEPTSGMDPYARRATWDLLTKHKQGRTILLTTHFMDEADLLGDRIAIMAEGQLRCSGSSLFLKSRYGVGYHMVITKDRQCNSSAIINHITSIIPGGKLSSDVGAELSFILPSTMASKFHILFDILEDQKEQLGITGFGISVTTMEEVFMKVGDSGVDETALTSSSSHNRVGVVETTPLVDNVTKTIEFNTGFVLWIQQFYGLFVKRFLHSLRNWRAIITQVILPILFVILGLVLVETVPEVTSEDEQRQLSMSKSALLDDNIITFFAEFGSGSPIFKNSTRIDEYKLAIGATKLENLLDGIQSLVNSTRDRTITNITDCYNTGSYQILDTYCASQTTTEYNCMNDGNFAYSRCCSCIDCHGPHRPHLASCSFPNTRNNEYFSADYFCPYPPSISVTEPLPVMANNSQPLEYMSYFVDEELMRLADERFDTSDFFRRYMAGFVISKHENAVSHCGTNYVRTISNSGDELDTKDLACLMLGFTPIVESNPLFTDSSFRQSIISNFSQFENCTNNRSREGIISCLFLDHLILAYNTNSTVKYPNCNNISLSDAYEVLVDQGVIEHAANISGDFRVDGAVRQVSDDLGANGDLVGRQYAPLTEITGATIYYNNQPFHMPAAALNAFHTIYLRHILEESGATETGYTITVNNHPLPRTAEGEVSAAADTFLGFSLASTVIFGLSFLAASFILYPVAEKASKAKHIQFVSGVHVTSFWTSAYLWDLINCSIPVIVSVILFAAFPIESYRENIGAVFLLFLFFCWSIIPFVYAFSFLFSNSLIAFALTILLSYFSALFCLIIVFVLDDDDEEIASNIFILMPSYAFSHGLAQIHTNYVIKDACKDNVLVCAERGLEFTDNILEVSYPAIGANIIVMALEGVVFFVLTLLLEQGFFIHKLASCFVRRKIEAAAVHPDEDSDVAQEKIRIDAADPKDDLIQIKNLKKEYKKWYGGTIKYAVNGLSLGIPKGECFGLLGVNGAGKTTTFKMLTGDIRPSSGTAIITGYDIVSDIREVQQHIGYCPQFDALIDDMTGYELLWLYARLRGIPEAEIEDAVNKEIKRLDLSQHAKNTCGNYSGGNKRKLSTAVSLVGSPSIVLLDEPTTGMDPATRRHLWDALITVIKAGRSIVLTSHSMEECEALCTRLAIMVNGEFKCLGGIQHLKTKFGKGYTLQVKIDITQQDVPLSSGIAASNVVTSPFINATASFHDFINSTFEHAVLIEEHQGAISYQLSGDNVSWSQVFRKLEENKDRLLIIDYSVSQTTLEQVFLNFAREQHVEEISS